MSGLQDAVERYFRASSTLYNVAYGRDLASLTATSIVSLADLARSHPHQRLRNAADYALDVLCRRTKATPLALVLPLPSTARR